MVDNVLEDYPLYEPSVAKRRINDHLRDLISRRPWSGTTKRGILDIPDAYTTGTVSVSNNTSTVTGSSTVWPTNDKVNTTLSAAVIEENYQEATPDSMNGISPGVWLLLDPTGPNEEAVFVIATTGTTFTAKFTSAHLAGETVARSSLAGQQIKVAYANSLIYTVIGVPSATSILIDLPWASASAASQTYTISPVYVSFGHDCKQLLTVVNMQSHIQLTTHYPKDYLDIVDSHRSATQSTHMCVFHETDPSGAPLWELYPRPTSKTEFAYFYSRQVDPLENDYDSLPNGIRSDVVVKLVRSDAARWPKHRTLDSGVYYDPGVGRQYLEEGEVAIQRMIIDDDNTSIMRAYWDFRALRVGNGYWRDHDWGPGDSWDF